MCCTLVILQVFRMARVVRPLCKLAHGDFDALRGLLGIAQTNVLLSPESVSSVADLFVMYLSYLWQYTECLKLLVPIDVRPCYCGTH